MDFNPVFFRDSDHFVKSVKNCGLRTLWVFRYLGGWVLGYLLRVFGYLREELLRYNIPNAIGRAAGAGMLLVILQVVIVIERDLLARTDVAQGHDPDAFAISARLRVGRTTVVQPSRRVP